MSEFKPICSIPGYEDYINYEMDINGDLRRDGRILKWSLTNRYHRTAVCMNGKHKMILQHRAIAMLFIPNPDNKPCVDHRNRNPHDNRVENLRWCTHSENNQNRTTQRTTQRDNWSGYNNIRKVCQNGKYWFWKIRIILNGKEFTKHFRCLEADTEPTSEVIASRDQMLREYHGEFANL